MAQSEEALDPFPALQHLAQLQEQITSLRTLIPATIVPLSTASAQVSPEHLYSSFTSSAAFTVDALRNFRAAWEDNETIKILEQVRASLGKNAKDIVGNWWCSSVGQEMEDGPDRMQRSIAGERQWPEINEDQTMTGSDGHEDVSAILKAFRESTHGCIVKQIGEEQLNVGVLSGLNELNFTVQKPESAAQTKLYRVTCNGPTKLHDSITRCIEMRPDRRTLKKTLAMLAAYADLGKASCEKCKRLLDSSALPPTARRQRLVQAEVGRNNHLWDAFHEACL